MRSGLLLAGLLALVACRSGTDTETDTDTDADTDTDTDSDTDTDTDTDADTDTDFRIVVTPHAGGIDVDLLRYDGDGFRFGMADTSDLATGWYGEDCHLRGSLCHEFTGTAGRLTKVPIEEVRAGETTYFDESLADVTTYYVELDDGQCYTFGHDLEYFDDFGCDVWVD